MADALVYPYGAASVSALMKSRPEDFIVTEELGFEPEGEGEHLFLYIEKTGLTTHELIDRLARASQIRARNIGHSGLKDKNALCRQWLSLHLPGKEVELPLDEAQNYKILKAIRHRSKLRIGTHKSNHFEIRLRELESFPASTQQQIESIKQQGFANYFGAQRFGRRQDNVQQALKQLQSSRLHRHRKGLLISSLRSFLFNHILSSRLQQGYWSEPLEGDVFNLRGSRSIFSSSIDENIIRRYQEMDISSTGSLYGSGRRQLSGQAQELEQRVFDQHEEITACLQQQSAKLEMRKLRVAVDDLKVQYDAAQQLLELQVSLPTGSYLTSLLNHFVNTREPD